MLSAIFIGLGAIQLRNTSLTGNQDRDEENVGHRLKKDLTVGWIKKPPYTVSTNGSLDGEGHVLIRDVLLPYITLECGIFQA